MIRRRDLLLLGGLVVGAGGLIGRVLFNASSQALCEDDVVCGEREQQKHLPKAKDPIWARLKRCRVMLDKASGTYSLVPTDDIKAMAGQRVRVTGFVVPLDGSDQTQDFLIGVNTPVCFYHPPGAPNELMEVKSVSAVAWNTLPQTVEGTFRLIENNQMGVFFKLEDARPV